MFETSWVLSSSAGFHMFYWQVSWLQPLQPLTNREGMIFANETFLESKKKSCMLRCETADVAEMSWNVIHYNNTIIVPFWVRFLKSLNLDNKSLNISFFRRYLYQGSVQRLILGRSWLSRSLNMLAGVRCAIVPPPNPPFLKTILGLASSGVLWKLFCHWFLIHVSISLLGGWGFWYEQDFLKADDHLTEQVYK